MFKKKQAVQAKSFGSFCHNDSIFQTKLALLTFYNRKYSDSIEKIILILEYLQLISQSLFFHASFHNINTSSTNSALSNTILYFFKLINPSSLMPLNMHTSLSSTILLIILSCMTLKCLLFIYVAIIAYWNYQGNNVLLVLWRSIFKTQSRILCCFITSFWSAVILDCSKGTFQVEGMSESAIMGICSALIAIEYFFSFAMEIYFNYMLPTKNFLSAKNCAIQTSTLLQKLLLQIISVGSQSNYTAGVWIFSILNLTFTIIRSYKCYEKLILYHIKAIFAQNYLHSVVLSLNITCFLHTILYQSGYHEADTNFIIIVWIVLAILIAKVSHQLIARRIVNILSLSFEMDSPEILIYKVPTTKELRKYLKMPGKDNNKYDISYLLEATGNANRAKIFGLDAEFCKELNHYEDDEGIYIEYLIKLSTEFPENTLVKLYLTQTCLEDPSRHLKALKMTNELVAKKWSMSYLSAALLVHEIEKTVLARYHNNENALDLDLFAYIKSQMFIEELEAKMQEQADLKIKICENILGETAKIGLIYNFAQQVGICKQQTENHINVLTQSISDNYIEPFLLIAGYQLVLEYSQENFQKYIDLYLQKLIKCEKYFHSTDLKKANLYQNENILLMLSGAKTHCGRILLCSDSIQSVSGSRAEASRGSHVSTLFTSSFQPYYLDLFRQLFETGETTLLNKVQRGFFYNKDGYIVEVEFYLKIHPYLTHGLYLSMIVRPTNAPKEYLLIKEDGSIEGATKGLADTFLNNKSSRLTSGLYHVKNISEDLWNVNRAFNAVARTQERLDEEIKGQTPLAYQKALKWYNTFTSESRRIELIPMENSREKSYYDCSVSLLPCGPLCIKIIELDKFDIDGIENGDNARSLAQSEFFIGNFKSRDQMKSSSKSDDDDYDVPDEDSVPRSENIDCDENVNDEMDNKEKVNTDLNTWAGPLTTDRRLLTDRPDLENLENGDASPQNVKQTNPDQTVNKVIGRNGVLVNENQIEFMSSTQVPNVSNSKMSNRTFRRALAIDFHPRSFRAICLMFYGVTIMTLLSQVVLKVISDQTTETLALKTNLLSVSQLRTFRILLITVNCRGNLDYIIDPDLQTYQVYTGMAQTVKNIQSHALYAKEYNDQILEDIYQLNSNIKRNIFLKDVRIFGSSVDSTGSDYRNSTTFDVINEVMDSVQKLGTFLAHPEQLLNDSSYNVHNYIYRNNINDYLYKSQQITTVFVNSVIKERDTFQSTITMCLIIAPLLLGGIVLMIVVIIWRQYNIEKKHMLAFIRLKQKSVKDIQKRLITFKTKITEKDPIEFKPWLDSIEELVMAENQDLNLVHNYLKKTKEHVVDESETRARYMRYVVRVAFYILILIGVALFNFLSAQSSAKVIYKRQSQVEFANKLSELVGVIYCASGALFETNNTYLVRHKLANTTFIEGLANTTAMITQIPTAFQEEDGTYDPTIENMIFHYKTCDPYNFIPLHLYFCNFMLTNGAQITLLPLVTVFRDVVQGKISDYENCDRSTIVSLFNCAYLNIDYFLPSFVLTAIEAQMIGNVAMSNLEKSISDVKYQRKVFLIAFSVSLAVVSVLIWLQILKKLRDVYNDFKKVLQIFPPHLILSSFLLKNFLIQNSKGN